MQKLNAKAKSLTLELLKYMVLTLFAAIVVYPYFLMIISSLKTEAGMFDNSTFFPAKFMWINYKTAMEFAPFGRFFINTFILAAIVIISQITTCSLAAYGFARIDFKLNKPLFAVLLISMMIPNEATVISNFILVNNLKLMNTFTAMAMTSMTSVLGIFIMRQHFLSIPKELIDASYVDGCNNFMVFFKIFLPLSKTAVATVSIFAFISAWNSYMWPLTVTNITNMRTIQVGLRYMIEPERGSLWTLIMAASTVVIVPILLVFMFLQKYFVKGIASTGIKS